MFALGFLVVEMMFGGLQSLAAVYHLIDHSPVGQSAQVMVVDEDIGIQFACYAHVGCLLGKGGIHGIELQSALLTIVNGIVQQL